YGSLPDPAKRLFRLFAMIKAPDFPGWVAATLLDTDLTEAENVLDHLVQAQMLTVSASPTGQVRYSFHELIRMYALECLASTDNEVEQREALQRMLSAWLTLVEKAHRKEYGGDFTILHGNAPRLQLPEWAHQDPIDNPMDWLASERTALLSAIRQAAAADFAELCWGIALTSGSLFELRG